MTLVKEILRYFERSSLSLSVLGTLYPSYAHGIREDFRLRDALDQGNLPLKWYEELKWPSWLEERYGPSSRIEGICDPDSVRLVQQDLQYEKGEGTRRLGEKRKLVVSDASDDDGDDADRAHIRRRMDDNEVRRHANSASQSLLQDPSSENIKKLLGADSSDPVSYVALILHSLNNNRYRKMIIEILKLLADIWGCTCDRKEMLVARLTHDDFFFNSPNFTAFKMIKRLQVRNPSPSMLLLYNVHGVQIADFLALRTPNIQRRSLEFLEEYLLLPYDSRMVKLESYDFYNRNHLGSYLTDNSKIEFFIGRICERCKLMPGPLYFRRKRPAFVDSLIEMGKQGRMSAANAAKLVVAHTGDDFHDRRDAVLLAVRWPKLVRELHKGWNLIGRAPRFVHCDQNLINDVVCRSSLHIKQKDREITYIRSAADFDRMEIDCGSEQMMIVESCPNKDPRNFENSPGFILFRSPGGRIYGYFPSDLNERDHLQLLDFFSGRTIFTRTVDFVRQYLAKHAKDAAWINCSSLAEEVIGGRMDDSIASFLWGSRFCGVTREEWFTDPLSELQEYHAAYGINLVNDFYFHVGQDAILQRAE